MFKKCLPKLCINLFYVTMTANTQATLYVATYTSTPSAPIEDQSEVPEVQTRTVKLRFPCLKRV